MLQPTSESPDNLEGYFQALRDVLANGVRKTTRSGDVYSLHGVTYRVDLNERFPMLHERRVPWKNVVIELLWYLTGDTNVAFLREHSVRIWDAWADSHGEVHAGYGRHFRRFGATSEADGAHTPLDGLGVDQVHELILGLTRNPFGRRHVITAWDPRTAATANPPPCVIEQTYCVRPPVEVGGKPILDLCLTQRSADLAIGVPHNLACYALLTHLLCRFCNLQPGEIIHTMHDAHLYVRGEDGSGAEYDQVSAVVEMVRRRRERKGQIRYAPQVAIASEIRVFADLLALVERPTHAILQALRLDGYRPLPSIRMVPAP